MSPENPAADRQAWEETLSSIEAGLAGVRDQQDDAIATFLTWQAPEDIGPIPPDLAGRVKDCAIKMAEMIQGTAAHLDGVRRQAGATAGIAGAMQAPSRAVYLDTTA